MSSPLLSYAEAAEQVQLFLQSQRDNPLSALRSAQAVPLASAAGRVLAEPIYADRDQPPFPRSTRDGYACRAAEANTHQLLFIAQQIRAGQPAARPLERGEACEIMTGAPVPDGADAVFMVEHAEHASGFVRLAAPRNLAPGENIVPQGAESLRGALLLTTGTRLSAPQIALAAQCGYASLAVAPRPRVAVLTTGDEIVPVETVPAPSQIRNSNAPMLAALVESAGGEPILLTAPDHPEALDAALHQTLSADLAIDLLLVSGGISAGRFDLVADALNRRGARFFFAGVAIQPGKPVAFGQTPAQAPAQSPSDTRQIPFFALPGNPISSAVTFHLFAAPLLAALAGDRAPQPRFAWAQLTELWRGKAGLTRFLPAFCDFGPVPAVRVLPWQGSGDLAAFAQSNCFLVVSPKTSELPAGTTVQILLPWSL